MRRATTLLTVAAIALAATPAATAQNGDAPDVDCSIKTQKRYSLKKLMRRRSVRIPTTCDGATRVMVSFDISRPIAVWEHTPHVGRQDAFGDATFRAAGTKDVRLKLLKQTRNAIGSHRWIKVRFLLAVELPDREGYYFADPEDTRTAVFRR